MADMSVETSRIRDVVRDSKIRSDISSMLNQSSDSFLLGSFQGLAEQRHRRTRDVHRVGRDFPRVSTDEVVRKVLRCNSREENKRLDFNFKFDEGESWVHGWNGNEDPFNEFYDGYSDSDSLIVRFKRNLPDFVGFWHMEDLLTWIDAIDDFFEEVSPPERVKCKIVLYKMKGAAYYWWRRLQADRNEIGKDEIISWPRMKNLLLKRFSPAKCSSKCPFQSYNSSQAESVTENTGDNQDYIAGEDFVEEQSKELIEVMHDNCSTKVPFEPLINKHNGGNHMSPTVLSGLILGDNIIGNSEKSTPFTSLIEKSDQDCPLSSRIHGVEVLTPKCPNFESSKVEGEPNGNLIKYELAEPADQTYGLFGDQLKKGAIEGHEVGVKHDQDIKSKKEESEVDDEIKKQAKEFPASRYMVQIQSTPPIHIAGMGEVLIAFQDLVNHSYEKPHQVRNPIVMNRLNVVVSRFSNESMVSTYLFRGKCLDSIYSVAKHVSFLIDPGGVLCSIGTWSPSWRMGIPTGLIEF